MTESATTGPPGGESRPVTRTKRFRVETMKTRTGRYSLYMAYADRGIAERVAAQLKWVGATVRIVAA